MSSVYWHRKHSCSERRKSVTGRTTHIKARTEVNRADTSPAARRLVSGVCAGIIWALTGVALSLQLVLQFVACMAFLLDQVPLGPMAFLSGWPKLWQLQYSEVSTDT